MAQAIYLAIKCMLPGELYIKIFDDGQDGVASI